MNHIDPAEACTELGADAINDQRAAAAVFLWPLGVLLVVAAVATLVVLL